MENQMGENDYMSDVNAGAGAETPAPAQPPVDLTPLERRLAKISEAVTGLTRDNERRETQSKISEAEYRINQTLREAEGAVERAEKDIAAAYDAGDGVQIAKSQRALTEAIAKREQAKLDRSEFTRLKDDMNRREGGSSGARGQDPASSTQSGEGQKDTRNLNDWKTRNGSWYGVDTEMTKAAHEVDRKIRAAGVISPGSQDYFKAIDRQMAQLYPDKFRSTPATAGGSGGAPAGQQSSAGRGRIPREVLDGWRRMGLNVDDDKTLAGLVKGRETLVAKGILPEQPNYGQVRVR